MPCKPLHLAALALLAASLSAGPADATCCVGGTPKVSVPTVRPTVPNIRAGTDAARHARDAVGNKLGNKPANSTNKSSKKPSPADIAKKTTKGPAVAAHRAGLSLQQQINRVRQQLQAKEEQRQAFVARMNAEEVRLRHHISQLEKQLNQLEADRAWWRSMMVVGTVNPAQAEAIRRIDGEIQALNAHIAAAKAEYKEAAKPESTSTYGQFTAEIMQLHGELRLLNAQQATAGGWAGLPDNRDAETLLGTMVQIGLR